MASAASVRQVGVAQSLAPQRVASATTTNGTSLDLSGRVNNRQMRAHYSAVKVTGDLTIKIQDSDDNSAFSDITGATTGVLAATGAGDIYFQTTKRYVRAAAVTATTPDWTFNTDLMTAGKYL